jgi:hypothetical protein
MERNAIQATWVTIVFEQEFLVALMDEHQTIVRVHPIGFALERDAMRAAARLNQRLKDRI